MRPDVDPSEHGEAASAASSESQIDSVWIREFYMECGREATLAYTDDQLGHCD